MFHTCVGKASYFLSAKTKQTYHLFLETCLLQTMGCEKGSICLCLAEPEVSDKV